MFLRRFASPIIVIVLGLLVMVRVLALPTPGTAADLSQSYPPDWTPETILYDPYPYGTPTEATTQAVAPEDTVVPTSASPTRTLPNSTRVATNTAIPSDESEQFATPSATPTYTPTRMPGVEDEDFVEIEPSPTPDPMQAYAVCVPNEPLLIRGEGPAFAPFLLYFEQRAVSGGTVGADGLFEISLIVGRERPGSYEVSVRLRENGEVLRQLECSVPATPTPTPIRGRP
jgi:hypothetical protein